MEKFSVKKSKTMKLLSYIALPILIALIICNIAAIIYTYQNPELKTVTKYQDSSEFSASLSANIIRKMYQAQDRQEMHFSGEYEEYYNYQSYDELNNGTETLRYEYYTDSNIQYLIVYPETNTAYTNLECTMKTDSIDKIKNIVQQTDYYWSYIDENITTNIEDLSLENIRYGTLYEMAKTNKVELYFSIPEALTHMDNMYGSQFIFNIMTQVEKIMYITLPILIIFFLIIFVYLLKAIGHKKGKEGIELDGIDKLPLELLGAILIVLECLVVAIFQGGFQWGTTIINVIGVIMVIVLSYVLIAIGFNTFVKRIKAKTLITNTLLYQIVKWSIKNIKKLTQVTFEKFNITLKTGVIYGIFIIIFISLMAWATNDGFGAFVLIIYIFVVFYLLLKRIKQFDKIKETVKDIYNGKTDIKLNKAELKGSLKEIATYLEDIAGGFSNAIEQGVKNERLKAELITNVSHDIKTPLTSIINYIDLLRKENIENEKAKEYLEILDNKSQRLKKLTEDLVEASKAASGNIKLNKENINIAELINQITGEMEDKLKAKGLEIIKTIEDEKTMILADSKYMCRIMENLFGNITKYALENSRIYVDIRNVRDTVKISIKNISKERLNITADELMQRFVRGDQARTTEGSGLGISIAKSLTEIQNGEFNLYVDGDLFKTELIFKIEK